MTGPEKGGEIKRWRWISLYRGMVELLEFSYSLAPTYIPIRI